jgi:alpha-tubulin suppressor-like RCC1 family protein
VNATYNTAADVPVTASSYTAAGSTVNLTLNFAPPVGTDLVVVQNTGLGFINGAFDNLANGQRVRLGYGGTNYDFVANYWSGTGNDLVLVWANKRPFAWGYNFYGQLGDNTTTQRLQPTPVATIGPLAGRTVTALAAGVEFTLALCADGTVAAWGDNYYGQLGDDRVSGLQSLVPVAPNAVSGISALHGKVVAAIAAGSDHSLALCADGTVAAWGNNTYGQLGDNTTTNRYLPVAVNATAGLSALYGKAVVAVAAGSDHSLALCADGTVAAWGNNTYGQLGDNTTTNRYVPVAVNTQPGISALSGKTVIAIAAGGSHSLALCSDGTVAAWGWNGYGQLGDATTTNRPAPVAVNTDSGVSALYGRTVTAISAGSVHSLAACSDSTVAAWGWNGYGQVDGGATTNHLVPVAVSAAPGVSALYGRTVVGVAAGCYHSLAFCSDGMIAGWGYNSVGQLGDNTTTQRNAPVAVDSSLLATTQRFTSVASGAYGFHTLAVVAAPGASAINLVNPVELGNGSFQFSFANNVGAFFGVLATTNISLPAGDWTALNGVTEVSPGQFQFIDPLATNSVQRFYRVRSP